MQPFFDVGVYSAALTRPMDILLLVDDPPDQGGSADPDCSPVVALTCPHWYNPGIDPNLTRFQKIS